MNCKPPIQPRALIILFALLAVTLLTACKPEARQPAGDLHLGLIWPEKAGTLSPQLAVGADGILYVMDDQAALHAVTPGGQELWIYQPGTKLAGAPVMSGDGSAVYFLTGDNELISVGTDGKLRWTFKADDVLTAAHVVAPDGAIYLHTRSGGHRVSPDGKSQPFTWPQYTERGQVAFDSQSQLALWSPADDQLVVLSPTGKVSMKCDEKTQVSYGPLIGKQDALIYALADGTLVARDAACQELWRSSLGNSQEQGAYYPLALATDGTIYAAGPAGRIQAFSAENGKQLWATEPVTAAGRLVHLAYGEDGMLYALSDQATLLGFRDGQQIWSQTLTEPEMPGPLEMTPDGGLAFIQAGQLYLFTRDAALTRSLPTPVPAPVDKAQAEKEIVDFLVDFIVKEEIVGTVDYIRNTGWGSEPPAANLIVWAPALEPKEGSFAFLQSDQPTQVWWYADGQLTEKDDQLKSIEDYKQRYMQDAKSDIFAWGYYEFGIVSLADDMASAKVYVGASCGPLCGHGFYYTLQRSPSGKWWIVDAQHLWQS